MTTWPNKPPHRAAYTLLEVLLAIGLIAILLGITVPMISDGFGSPASEAAEESLARTASAARASALDTSEARRVFLTDTGLTSDIESVPQAELPAGWKLQVRRMAESKFRRPARDEFWEFNSAGISEPVTFLLSNGRESVTLAFDPLTALVIRDEE